MVFEDVVLDSSRFDIDVTIHTTYNRVTKLLLSNTLRAPRLPPVRTRFSLLRLSLLSLLSSKLLEIKMCAHESYTHINIHVYVYIYIYMLHIYRYRQKNRKYIYIYMYTYICIYIYIHTYTCIYICIYTICIGVFEAWDGPGIEGLCLVIIVIRTIIIILITVIIIIIINGPGI